MALPFDRSEWFAFGKTADVPCVNLTPKNRCAIHDALGERGFAGCVRYDCSGAGQHATAKFLAGRDWRSRPDLERRVFQAFRTLRQVHELLLLLHEAGRLHLTPAQDRRRRSLMVRLERVTSAALEAVAKFDPTRAERATHVFLRSLRARAAWARPEPRRLQLYRAPS